MALNPFFLNGSQSEQGLVQSLINEQLKMYGIECYYMPRSYVTTNTVIQEVIQSEFKNAYPIEAYMDNYEGYLGQGTILSKFGIEDKDDCTLIISRERYENYIAPLMRDLPNIELTDRPKEGDLIYFPLGERLFEIKFVEHEKPFYQLKKNYVYTLTCELFRYEDEVIDTDVDEIDEEIAQIGYIQSLTMVGSGSTATGTTLYCGSGSVSQIYINNMGKKYSKNPTVGFTSAPGDGITASGIASITNEYIQCNGLYGGMIDAILLTNAGCGYTVPPMITIQSAKSDNGVGAAATCGIVTTGSVIKVNVTDGGSGYITAPDVFLIYEGSDISADSSLITVDSDVYSADEKSLPVGFTSATAISSINASGIVTAVYITNSGSGYVSAPDVKFGPPGIGTDVGIGTYTFNEVVVGSSSSTTARVKEWNIETEILEVSIVDGDFTPGEIIVGQESGARYKLRDQEEYDLVTPFADNDIIELEAKDIIDFTQQNPFGMP